MSSTKDPQREAKVKAAVAKVVDEYGETLDLLSGTTPQATKPVDEQIRDCFKRTYMQTEGDTELFDTEVTIAEIATLLKALLTEARINELENWAYCGASKWEIDERIAELKGEAPTPTKEREEQ